MIECKNVHIQFGEEEILKDVSFHIKKGETILLTGMSGSGKSTILKLINGLIPHYERAKVEGDIFVAGLRPKEMELFEISKVVSTVFQNPKTHFFNTDTTLELVFYLENIGVEKAEMERRLDDAVKLFDIEHLLHRSIFELSGGEKQILSIAAAYMSGNDIILFDEPTANLDHIYTKKVGEMLRMLKDRGKTIIIAEHRFYFLKDLVDRVFMMEKGKLVEEWTGDGFFKMSKEEFHTRGLRGIAMETIYATEKFNELEYMILAYDKKFPKHHVTVSNLGFKKGEIIGIIGRNGIGKSTLIKNLIGQEKDRISLTLHGKALKAKERIKHSYIVMQDVNSELFTESVLSECLLNGEKEKALEILTELGLEECLDRHPLSLSGGQKQRLVITTALLQNREILFFDEPTSGMDHYHMEKIAKLLEKIKEDRLIFIISHDYELLKKISDKILDLEQFVN
ncbi:MAG: ABC transporter ATP-binding protein [Tissierellia bacterium]|nr:ABC transporter ATP-binding protein [Tissierellia bacterium]